MNSSLKIQVQERDSKELVLKTECFDERNGLSSQAEVMITVDLQKKIRQIYE